VLPTVEYEKLSSDELIDVYENIDREKYPERFEKVKSLLGFNDVGEADMETTGNIELDSINKAKRIKDFFDSLSESYSPYHENYSGYDGGGSGGDSGGGGGDGGGC